MVKIGGKHRNETKPFTLDFLLKKGGKKLEKGSITFFPRDSNPEHVKKAVKNGIKEVLEKEV